MGKNRWLGWGIGALVILTLGVLLVIEFLIPARTIVVEIHGKPGTPIVGEIGIDGREKRLDGVLPATFTFNAQRAVFLVVADDDRPDQPLGCRVTIDGVEFGRIAYKPDTFGSGVSGEVRDPILFRSWRRHFQPASVGQPEDFRERVKRLPRSE